MELKKHKPLEKDKRGNISSATQQGLEEPTSETRLRTNDLPKVFGYLQFHLSVRGDQAIHPSQVDPKEEIKKRMNIFPIASC